MYTVEELKKHVFNAVHDYNKTADNDAKIQKVSLFGSYANGQTKKDSDVDLLVSFTSTVVSLFALARALDSFEKHLMVPVDVIQDPLPDTALFDIETAIPLYEHAR